MTWGMEEKGPFVPPHHFKSDGPTPYYKVISERLEGQTSLEDNTCVYIVWAVEKQYEDVR
jgi:hypothetical protein